jgi:hypothetical protein
MFRYESTWMSIPHPPSLSKLFFVGRIMVYGRCMLTHPVQELRRLGILHNTSSLESSRFLSSTNSWTVPATKSIPAYTIRQSKSRRLRRRPTWQGLPLKLSLSNLRDDHDLARLLSSVYATEQTVHAILANAQEQTPLISADKSSSTPQSLPKPSPSSSALVSSPTSPINDLPISLSQSFNSIHSLAQEDWTFITPIISSQEHVHPSIASTPFSEPETWILLGDDL